MHIKGLFYIEIQWIIDKMDFKDSQLGDVLLGTMLYEAAFNLYQMTNFSTGPNQKHLQTTK